MGWWVVVRPGEKSPYLNLLPSTMTSFLPFPFPCRARCCWISVRQEERGGGRVERRVARGMASGGA